MSKILMRGVFAGIALLLAAGAAQAQAPIVTLAQVQTIACPVTQATRTITTPPPAEWWTTPLVASLSQTRIEIIGGQTALVCVYGTAGTIQRYAPAGTNCTPTSTGFQCVPLVPPIRITATIEILPITQLDLDTGAATPTGTAPTGADIRLQPVSLFETLLFPSNGATLALGNRLDRGYLGCGAEAFSGNPIPMSTVPVGSFICVRTSEGRISQVRVDAFGPILRSLRLSYTTWQ